MAKAGDAPEVQRRLLAWYADQARDLPWRRTRDPYAILVAEVMLQQTQVERVIPRWQAWLDAFPTFAALAGASRADAIRAWQGLGYNLRAVRLHDLARQVMTDFGGRLPADVVGLQALTGIGRYTAAAVACFAYEQPVAAVDTNVRRVLGRVFDTEPGDVEKLAAEVLPPTAAYPWNQALMDLGATLCRSRAPLCLACPLVGICGGPARPAAVTAPRLAPHVFRGSQRYYRGRLIEALRVLPAGESIALDDVLAVVCPEGDRERVAALVRRLAADGLLIVDGQNDVRLPD